MLGPGPFQVSIYVVMATDGMREEGVISLLEYLFQVTNYLSQHHFPISHQLPTYICVPENGYMSFYTSKFLIYYVSYAFPSLE
jgi:hypothetical protein